MRMEEFSDSRYIKSTDQIERYLLGLVEQYCNSANINSSASREYIINKAVKRMKEEVNFDSLGVLSITLPNGEVREGAVTLTLEDFNGEPLISPKLSAFNVSFGNTANTACEGDDPRLSDARKPIAHTHDVSEILGLSGMISSMNGLINRVNASEHTHSNQSVLDKITYSGVKNTINLTQLDTLKDEIQQMADDVRQNVVDNAQAINNKVSEVELKINDLKTYIDDLKQYIVTKNDEAYKNSTDYTDTKLADLEINIKSQLDNFVDKDTFDDILMFPRNNYTLAGKSIFAVQSIISGGIYPIDASLLTELTSRGATISDSLVNITLEYTSNGVTFSYPLPYLEFTSGSLTGMIQAEVLNNGTISFSTNLNTLNIPNDILNGNIVVTIYSKS